MLLAGVGLVSYQNLTSLIQTTDWQREHYKVINELEDIRFQLQKAAIAKHRYITTKEARYLKPYDDAAQAIKREITQVQQAIANKPDQQGRLAALETLVTRKWAEIEQTTNLRKTRGLEAASQPLVLEKGKKLTDDIEATIHEMVKAESVLWTGATLSQEASARNTILTNSCGIFLTFFLFVGVYYFMRRELGERKRTEVALEKERDFTCAVLDTSGALVVVLDSQGRIVRFNRACEQTTGYLFAEVRGEHVWDLFLIPEEMEQVRAIFENLQGGQFSNCHENYWVTREGDCRLIAWSNTILCDMVDAVEYVISTGIDITERKRAEEQVHFLQTLTLAIAKCGDFDEALAVTLRTVCETKGWNYGEAWIPCPNEIVLKCSPAWYSRADGVSHSNSPGLDKFRRLSEEFTFPPGAGLPGRVWSSKQPEWQEDVSRQSEITFQRSDIALSCGLRAGMGIPLLINEQVLAVLVFFKFESSNEDLRLVESISAVAAQISSVMHRKRMEQVLRESEELFQAFMNNSPAVAFMKDEQGRYVYVNEPFERHLNIKLANLLGKTDFEVWPSEIALQVRENDTRVLTEHKTVEIVETVPAPDGCLRHWLSFKFPCKDISGRRLLGGVAVDITERQQAESELLESQTRLLLINSISTGITSGMSVEQVIERTLEQISGYFNTLRVAYSTVDQQGTLTVLYSIEPRGMAQLKGLVADLNAAPEYLNALLGFESVIVEDVATSSRLAPLADAMLGSGNRAVLDVALQHSEQLVGLLCFDSPVPRKWSEHEIVTLREVANYLAVAIKEANAQLERKHAEEALKESEERFRWMADSAPVFLWMTDDEGGCTYVNKPWLDFTGQTLDAELGMGWTDGVPPEDWERCSAIFRKAFTAREDVQMEHRLRHNDGQYRWLLVSGTPRFIGEAFAGYIGSCVDITDRKIQEAELSQANEKLKSWVNELEQRNREIALLSKMSDFLQACLTVEEAYAAISQLVQPLFPQTNGGIYLISASKNLVETVATWGSPFPSQELFTPHECWALRRGRAHWIDDSHSGFLCKHIHHESLPTESLCVPMMAQGEAIGVLYLSSQELGRLTEPKQQLATTVAEHIALAVANLKLRSTLQNQSIRDSLTGLFNRLYMEESLEREMHRCDRKQQPLSIIMIDVDHFKRFNDTFGHDAGDTVLRELGLFLQKHIRKSDIACRYGGEELTLILPESSLEIVQQRAEQIREGAKHLNVYHERQPLGAITLSLGVACFPEDGTTGEAVLRAADAALYRAKKSGRDRVVSASSSTSAASNIDCAR